MSANGRNLGGTVLDSASDAVTAASQTPGVHHSPRRVQMALCARREVTALLLQRPGMRAAMAEAVDARQERGLSRLVDETGRLTNNLL